MSHTSTAATSASKKPQRSAGSGRPHKTPSRSATRRSYSESASPKSGPQKNGSGAASTDRPNTADGLTIRATAAASQARSLKLTPLEQLLVERYSVTAEQIARKDHPRSGDCKQPGCKICRQRAYTRKRRSRNPGVWKKG